MYKKLILTYFFALSLGTLIAQDIPAKSATLVTDYTNTLTLQDKDILEHKLVAYNDSTSTQIAVVIMKSTGSYDIAQYAVALGRNWGVGQKGINNGILLLVALDDHKVTIQTGYGAEAKVPDAITSKIIEEDIKPNFKQGNYYAGLDAATSSLIKYMKGEYKADGNNAVDKTAEDNGGSIGIVIFIVIVILIIIFRNIGGGGGQIIGRRGGASPFWWFLAGSALGGGFNNNDNGGGGFGGGDSGGGGFGGGFGGGSFGGGGSSGSW